MKNNFLRRSRSVSQPKKTAPSTAPARYALPARPTSALENCRTGLCLRAPATVPARVTSRPSRIHVMPSAATTSVWKRPHGKRSSRAGMSVSTIGADWEVGASMWADNVTAGPFVQSGQGEAGPAAEQEHAGLRGVLAHQSRRRPDLFHVEWRGLVKLIDPVAEQQVCVAAPAVFRLTGRVVLRKIVAWRRDRFARRDVTKILVGERTRVVLDVIEHMQRAMRGIVQQAKPGLIRLHQNLQSAPWRNVFPVHIGPARDGHREVVRKAAQVRRRRCQVSVAVDTERLLWKRILRHAMEMMDGRLRTPADVEARMHIGERPVEHTAQFVPVGHLLERYGLDRRARHDEAVELLRA